ncbi:MAG: hypothetical protein ACI4GV_06780 [Acutalibacteraceae bacterium]
MKYRKLSVITAILTLSVVLAAVFSATVYAADECRVIYEGQAERFVFIPESTDLFRNFKNVCPGDSINQSIEINNNSDKTVSVYLRAETVDKEYCDFLDKMNLCVSTADGRIISDSKASEQGGLKNNVLIGTFSSGESTSLDLQLNADRFMDNSCQNRTGEVRWIFSVTEAEDSSGTDTSKPTNTDIIPTGDSRNNITAAVILMLAVSFAAGTVVIISKKKYPTE